MHHIMIQFAPKKQSKAETMPGQSSQLRKDESQKNSMWENPECCVDTCPDFFPRFDELYYKTSDKLKRNYQQTWLSCPEIDFQSKAFVLMRN
ncbi:hypothetical protein EVAR_72469_1 [Eumeta japonica]|uniref:Uncharacterized protein n=1 Tax=Eumeta variegata TaxID=151549 RepID=A0A4C1T6C0_EUMVA|nr:hypothetical protein EVAR_72469_1 [Eumeta japonica]